MPTSSAIRFQIESALAQKIPCAFTPVPKMIRPVAATGIVALDEVLKGGLPVGAVIELVGPECSGRTSVALSFLSRVTQTARVCAWIDVSNTLDPASAAAAGVDLARLLWVRCGVMQKTIESTSHSFALPEKYLVPPAAKKGLHGGGFGPHPRTEAKGLSQAVRGLLRPEAIEPRCVEPQRRVEPKTEVFEPTLRHSSTSVVAPLRSGKPWSRMEQALRATDLLLQGGGFSAIVLDLGSLTPEAVSRVPLATWYRYRAAAERTQSSILLLTQHPCAKSSAALMLRFQPANCALRRKNGLQRYRAPSRSCSSALYRNSNQCHPLAKASAKCESRELAEPHRMGRSQMTKPAELYACLYVKEFPAQAILRLRPGMHSRPCVVMEGEPPLQIVCALNTKARLLHLSHGMTRVEVDTFPNPVVLSRSRETEMATKAILLECAGAFSPRVEERSQDTAFLCGIDISGTQNLFGSPEKLARSLVQRVRAVGITARVTVSSNFQTAACVAKGLSPSAVVRVVPPGEEATSLASLPIVVIDPTEIQAEIFALWGIHTLGMLAALPEKELIARMGQDGKRLRQLARGERPHLFQPAEPAFALAEKMELDSPVELLESLLFAVGVMLDQLILRAKARILALASVTIALTLDGGGTHTRTVRPPLPSMDKQLWIKLLHLDLETHPPQAAILAVVLDAEPGSTSKVQLGLFSPQLPEAARLDVTLARIRAIVGENCVGRAVLQDTHAPEGFRMEPFTVSSGDSAGIGSPQPRASMRQLRPPEPASVTLRNSQPAMFFYRERRYAVEHAYGPWLVGGDWWNQTLWGSEQWDLVARAEDGPMLCCCMMRDLMRNQWQMAALYD